MARINYFIFHENTTTISEGSEFIIDNITNPDSIGIEITGTCTSCLIKFQAQMIPLGEWRDVAGLRANDFFLSSNTTRLNEFWLFDINSFYKFRVNIIDILEGDITIKGKISKTI